MRGHCFLVLALIVSLLGCAPERSAHLRGRAPAQFREITLGLCEDYPEESRSLQQARRDLELVSTNGLDVLRIAFGWDAMEPERGRYDWSFWDEFIRMATDEYNVRLIPYVCYTPKWASSDKGEDSWRHPPADNSYFANFLRQLVTRYRDRIKSWEIWNEPDNAHYWLGSVDQFAGLLHAGVGAVRQADPSAKIVFGGIAWNVGFLEGVLTNSPAAFRELDAVNLHNYYETWSSDPIERLPSYTGSARDVLRRHGAFQALWLAEVGYSSYRRGSTVSGQFHAFYDHEHTPEHQGVALFRMLTLAWAAGHTDLVAWYRVNDLPDDQEVIGDVNNRYLGVLDVHGRPKPALRSLRTFNQILAGPFRCVSDQVRITQSMAVPVEAHAFERPDGSTVVVAWMPVMVPGDRGAAVGERTVDSQITKIELAVPGRHFQSIEAFNDFGDRVQEPAPRLFFRKSRSGVKETLITRMALNSSRSLIVVLR